MALVGNAAGLLRSLAQAAWERRRRGPLRPGWTLFQEALFEQIRRTTDAMATLPPEQQRARFEATVLPTPISRRVKREAASADAPPGEWLSPKAGPCDRTVLYLHGGGFVTGSLRSYRELASRIALEAQARVFVLDYRLAPEHPFPAAAEDAAEALRWLLAREEPRRVAVAGDSAGGCLAVQSMIARRDAGGPLPAAAALISPIVDLTLTAGSLAANEPSDVIGRPLAHRWCALYLNGQDPREPRASPLFAELGGLPQLLLQAGGAEMLLDDSRRFAERARQAGVSVKLEVEPEMPHDWHLTAAAVPQARAALSRIGQFLRAAIPPG